LTPKGEGHAVSMTFYPNEKTWQFMDVNSFPPKEPSNKEELITILPISSYQSFSLRGILPSHDFTKLQESLKISSVTQNLTHVIDLLHHASRQGDLETVEMLLAMHVDPNSGKSEGVNPLYIAAQNGHVEVVRALLAKGTNPNQALDDGATPLLIAAQLGHVEVVRALLAHDGIEPNKQKSNGVTPLLIAAYDGNTKLVRALLDKGANPNLPMADGATPLFVAAEKGYLEVVQELLAHDGIEPNKAMNDGATPLFIAAEKGCLEVVQELLAHVRIKPNQAMINGATPLFIAEQNGCFEVVEALLKHENIDVTIAFKSTQDSLEEFARNKILKDDALIKRMDEYIARFKELYPKKELIEITPQEIATIMGHEAVLELLSNPEQSHTGLKLTK
jgi:ankyrin repeat protein